MTSSLDGLNRETERSYDAVPGFFFILISIWSEMMVLVIDQVAFWWVSSCGVSRGYR